MSRHRGRTPILVDDIISTGQTMVAAVRLLRAAGARPPVCLAIHAVFAGDAEAELRAAGAARIVTTDTIPHPSNGISIVDPVADAVRAILDRPGV